METGNYFLQAILSMNSRDFFISSRTDKALNNTGSYHFLNPKKPSFEVWCLHHSVCNVNMQHLFPKVRVFHGAPSPISNCRIIQGLGPWRQRPYASVLYPSHISPFPLSWKHNYGGNKTTAGPCKQHFLKKVNTAVLVRVSGEDHCQQTSVDTSLCQRSPPQLWLLHSFVWGS